jgi:hypothetical protein
VKLHTSEGQAFCREYNHSTGEVRLFAKAPSTQSGTVPKIEGQADDAVLVPAPWGTQLWELEKLNPEIAAKFYRIWYEPATVLRYLQRNLTETAALNPQAGELAVDHLLLGLGSAVLHAMRTREYAEKIPLPVAASTAPGCTAVMRRPLEIETLMGDAPEPPLPSDP